jgi:hypothetical protein
VLNGQYDKAIEVMGAYHRDFPENEDFQYVILDALFALGKTENDFPWVEAPTLIRLDASLMDYVYEYLRPKRKPRSVHELHTNQYLRGYVTFSPEELFQALAHDDRFIVESEGDCIWAEVSVRRKGKRSKNR